MATLRALYEFTGQTGASRLGFLDFLFILLGAGIAYLLIPFPFESLGF